LRASLPVFWALIALAVSPARRKAERALPLVEKHWANLSNEGQLEAARLVGVLASQDAQAAALFQKILAESPPEVATATVQSLRSISNRSGAVLRHRLLSLPLEQVRSEVAWQQLAIAIGTRLERKSGPFHLLEERCAELWKCGYDSMNASAAEESRRASAEIIGGEVWLNYQQEREAAERAETDRRGTLEREKVRRVGGGVVHLIESYSRGAMKD
jgi:hypothetical protein